MSTTTKDQTNMQQGVPKMDGNSRACLQFISGPRVRRFWSSLLLPIFLAPNSTKNCQLTFHGISRINHPPTTKKEKSVEQKKSEATSLTPPTSPRSRKSLDQFQPSRLGQIVGPRALEGQQNDPGFARGRSLCGLLMLREKLFIQELKPVKTTGLVGKVPGTNSSPKLDNDDGSTHLTDSCYIYIYSN